MTLIEVYRGYEIHEVEKRGRKMFQAKNVSTFSLETARTSIDKLFKEGQYIMLCNKLSNPIMFGFTSGGEASEFLTYSAVLRKRFQTEVEPINLTMAEL